jgi:hypothetical protein
MRIHRLIRRRIRRERSGVAFTSDVNVAAAANIGERGAVTTVTDREHDADDPAAKRGK